MLACLLFFVVVVVVVVVVDVDVNQLLVGVMGKGGVSLATIFRCCC